MATSAGAAGPWFRRRPGTAAAVVVALFAAITAARFMIEGDDPLGLLFSLPIALAALAYGQRAGLATAALGIAIVELWSLLEDVSIGAAGWMARIVPLALLGLLLGRAADQQQEAEAVRVRLAVAEAHRRDAAEINDLIVQRLAAARWTIEAGNVEPALAELEEVIGVAQRLVAELLAAEEMADRMRTRGPSSDLGDLGDPLR
ncbi:MAG TPA: hypothetical protein VM262_02020 [Acidimicrobiales bacterium]|nr:hypothetical protein [Acidimicrobiales bacterium]